MLLKIKEKRDELVEIADLVDLINPLKKEVMAQIHPANIDDRDKFAKAQGNCY